MGSKRGLLVVAALVLAPAIALAQEPPPANKQPFPGIHIYPGQQRIEVDAVLARDFGLLELVGCVRKGKAHESLLILKASPRDLNLACIAAGFVPAEKPGDTGSQVELILFFLGEDGKEVLIHVEDAIWNQRFQNPMVAPSWYYRGGLFATVQDLDENGQPIQREVYVPEYTGTMITLYHDPNAIITPSRRAGGPEIAAGAPPAQYIGWDEYIADERVLPEQFSELILIIRAPEDPSRGYRKQGQYTLHRGLFFLLKEQNENGSWGEFPGMDVPPGHVGITALALRALADAPAEARPEGAEAAIARATAWIVAQRQPDGSIYVPAMGDATYNTALAAMALKAVDAKAHAEILAGAKQYLEHGQFGPEDKVSETDRNFGGWGYGQDGEPDADLSNTQHALEALKALEEMGLPTDGAVLERARAFVGRCQNLSETNRWDGYAVGNDGGFIYDPGFDTNKSEQGTVEGKPSFASYSSMTYAGLKSLLHAKVDRNDPRVKAAVQWILANYTLRENYGLGTRDNPKGGQQGLFYYYMTFAKSLDAWGEPILTDAKGGRHVWAAELIEELSLRQDLDGSWVNEVPRWWENDKILVTTYSCNAITYALRNLPSGK